MTESAEPMVPLARFSTDVVGECERFDLWRESVGVVFGCDRKHAPDDKPFHASMDAILYDQVFLARTRSQAAHYTREPDRIRRDGQDMAFLQLFLKGSVQFGYKQQTHYGKQGEIVVFDLSKEVDNFNTDFDHLSLCIARDEMEQIAPNFSQWHGWALPDTPAIRLLADHLISTHSFGGRIAAQSAPHLKRATLELVSLAFRDAGERIDMGTQAGHSALIEGSLKWQIKKHLRQNLNNPELSIAAVAERFGLSRAGLFRQFSEEGGLMEYVREQRINRAIRDLEDPACDSLGIAEIAYRWGFGNPTTFSRSVKRVTGSTPKDLRRQRSNPLPSKAVGTPAHTSAQVDRRYEEWMLGMRT